MEELYNIDNNRIKVHLEKNKKICINIQINNTIIRQVVYNKSYEGFNAFATINVNRVKFFCELTTLFINNKKYRLITYFLN